METIIEIVGVNGETATIAGDRAGDRGVYALPDIGGLVDPEVSVVSETPANYPGGRYVSHRIQIRRVMFAVDILDDGSGSDSWRFRDSEWRKMWAYDKPTEIRLTTRDGTRSLFAHLESITVDTEIDPNIQPIVRCVMTAVAYDPFWWADDEVFEAEVASGTTVTIPVRDANPTDQDVFPIWVVEPTGTWTLPDYSFDVDVPEHADRTIELPNLVAGEYVVVNSNPGERQLTSSSGSPVWQRMNGKRFRYPIAPYTRDVDFKVSYTGTGTKTVQLRLRRPYSRPWGLL